MEGARGARLAQRGLVLTEIEAVLGAGRRRREINRGDADWRLGGVRADGRQFVVIYDHPVNGNRTSPDHQRSATPARKRVE